MGRESSGISSILIRVFSADYAEKRRLKNKNALARAVFPALAGFFFPPGRDHRKEDGNKNDGGDGNQRNADGNVRLKPAGRIVVGVDEHFDTDENEDDSE